MAGDGMMGARTAGGRTGAGRITPGMGIAGPAERPPGLADVTAGANIAPAPSTPTKKAANIRGVIEPTPCLRCHGRI